MKILICLIIGYLIGMISPAAMLSKWKHVNLKKEGTGNLGASNTMIVLGRSYGVIVMVIDILKAYLAGRLALWLFPELTTAGFLAGLGAVVGHVYPFYLHFRGGKGLACLGGMICLYNPWLLLFYLTGGVVLMILANRSVFLPVFASITFPIIMLVQTGDWSLFAVAVITSVLIMFAHRKNFGRVKRGEEAPMREFIKTKVFKTKSKKE